MNYLLRAQTHPLIVLSSVFVPSLQSAHHNNSSWPKQMFNYQLHIGSKRCIRRAKKKKLKRKNLKC